ncbi:MAG: hypothetical protein JOY90_00410 [Bradyrhizobium sp.]|uniref:hypothetical protein n=1 Tax=Bradyrhizobium sp. TaxID=376 RepID=UPI001D49206D|nr:hypothetical protein [Bradyrhizobium sp.]MBV9558917.1 hypothetical protein [Bradyrhizobium sp.]
MDSFDPWRAGSPESIDAAADEIIIATEGVFDDFEDARKAARAAFASVGLVAEADGG